MFWNIYSKRVLSTLRNKESLIWTWIFPIMLATLFHFTLSSIDTAGQLAGIPLGVVDNAAYRRNTAFRSALESVSGDGGLFSLTTLDTAGEADALLERGELEGYILMDGEPVLVVADDGLNQTIAKSFLGQYLQTKNSVETLLSQDPSAAGTLAELLEPQTYTKKISLTKNPPSDAVGYFYALLAMACLYGCFQGLTTVTYLQANLSPLGARRTMAPVGRFRAAAYDLMGGITVHLASLLILVAYIIFALKVSFGPNLGPVLLTCLTGSLLGIAFGAMVSAASKLKEQATVAILISVSMVCCFLSGLMMSGINYLVAQKAPPVSWLNPAARIADAFYCLYYYDTYERYFLNIGIILTMALAMFAAAALLLRRQRYESL